MFEKSKGGGFEPREEVELQIAFGVPPALVFSIDHFLQDAFQEGVLIGRRFQFGVGLQNILNFGDDLKAALLDLLAGGEAGVGGVKGGLGFGDPLRKDLGTLEEKILGVGAALHQVIEAVHLLAEGGKGLLQTGDFTLGGFCGLLLGEWEAGHLDLIIGKPALQGGEKGGLHILQGRTHTIAILVGAAEGNTPVTAGEAEHTAATLGTEDNADKRVLNV